MRIPGLEKRLGKAEQGHLPKVIQLQMSEIDRYNNTLLQIRQSIPRTRSAYIGREDAEKIQSTSEKLEKAKDKLQKLVSENANHSAIMNLVTKGATHFHNQGNQLHFVMLGKKHAGKKYVPIAGETRFPIHINEPYVPGL